MVTTSEELLTASRSEIQDYLEGRGFAVYDSEGTEQLRIAAVLDAKEVEAEEPDWGKGW